MNNDHQTYGEMSEIAASIIDGVPLAHENKQKVKDLIEHYKEMNKIIKELTPLIESKNKRWTIKHSQKRVHENLKTIVQFFNQNFKGE